MAEAAPGREVAAGCGRARGLFFFACRLPVLKGAWSPQWHLGHCGLMAMPALAAAAQGQARPGQFRDRRTSAVSPCGIGPGNLGLWGRLLLPNLHTGLRAAMVAKCERGLVTGQVYDSAEVCEPHAVDILS